MQNTHTRRHTIARWGMTAGGIVLSGLVATVAFGQEGTPSSPAMHHGKAMTRTEANQTTDSPCPGMTSARGTMMSDIASMNAELDDLLAKMDAAEGNAKVEAMGQVIHELVAQRTRMVDMLSSMRHARSGHMTGHMPGDTSAETETGHMMGNQGHMGNADNGMGHMAHNDKTSPSGHMMAHPGSASDDSDSTNHSNP
jgi:FlaG/FlaF family flagellin (archaellin)